MTAAATKLALVPDIKTLSAAERLHANQEAQKADAKNALTDLLARAAEVATEAKGLSTLEAYTAKEREALTALGINTTGSIAALTHR